MLRRRSGASVPTFYKGVPVVNLLSVEKPQRSLRMFGSQGRLLLVRALLLLLVVAGAVAYLFASLETQRYQGLEETAGERADVAAARIDEALALQDEIEELEGRGSISQRDFVFLKGEPAALIAAIQSVIAIEVTGIEILSVETAPPNGVNVQIRAESNFAALEWRRLIGSAPGVDRVLSFDPSPDSPLVYDVQLISGGG